MKLVLTLFMLAVFVMFATVDNAEAILNPEADSFLADLEVEAVSIAPSVFVLERAPNEVVLKEEAETVSDTMKWPHERGLDETGLDTQNPTGIENSSAEGRTVRIGIWPSGASR